MVYLHFAQTHLAGNDNAKCILSDPESDPETDPQSAPLRGGREAESVCISTRYGNQPPRRGTLPGSVSGSPSGPLSGLLSGSQNGNAKLELHLAFPFSSGKMEICHCNNSIFILHAK